MGRKGRSVRIARGIFRDATAHRVQASFRGKKMEQRFPLSATLRDMKEWQEDARAKLRKGRVIIQGPSGTLSADVKRYLSQIKHQASYKSRRSELHAWTAEIGSMRRSQITQEHVRVVVGKWSQKHVAPKTIRNRLVALASLYHLLDTEPGQPLQTPSPTDGVTIQVPKKRPVYVSTTIVKMVEANLRKQEEAGRLRDAKTRGRFMVMAATGVRPSQLRRVEKHEVDLKRRTWQVPSGKGGEPISLYLNDDMLAAWKVFVAADAWGDYDSRSMARVLRTAGWPTDIRPYNVRHAIGHDLSERGEDLQDIADWMGHSDVETTRQFYVPILNSRLASMSKRLEGRLGWAKVPQSVPQSGVRCGPKRSDSDRKAKRAVQTKSGRSPKKTAR